MELLTMLQIQEEAASPTIDNMQLSLWDLAVKGGWLMIPLVLLWVIGLYIFFERYLSIRKASRVDGNFMNRIRELVIDDKLDAARELCQKTDIPVARMVGKGIDRIGRPIADLNTAIENVGNLEVAKLERGLPMLATISGGAPMIGFLGTVVGMIQAFYDMSMAGNNLDIALLSNGIYTAMVTTVAGLIVGIMAYFGYNFLVARVDRVVFQLEASSLEFVDLLNEPVE
ncbi:MAG: MotA/TolQ/ExbB proton channel family protein [Bacteroidia bacterium]|nr:MotA/TolQ/ExbB proton channel family protein [Bacteroidia bacterium]